MKQKTNTHSTEVKNPYEELSPESIIEYVQKLTPVSADTLSTLLAYLYELDTNSNSTNGNKTYKAAVEFILENYAMHENILPIDHNDSNNNSLLNYTTFYQLPALQEYFEYVLGYSYL